MATRRQRSASARTVRPLVAVTSEPLCLPEEHQIFLTLRERAWATPRRLLAGSRRPRQEVRQALRDVWHLTGRREGATWVATPSRPAR